MLGVAVACRRHVPTVLIFNDGSTDLPSDFPASCAAAGVEFAGTPDNHGKGAAILAAARLLAPRGFTTLITVDADGQLSPDDLPAFLSALAAEPDILAVGKRDLDNPSVPTSSRRGCRFGNFWFWVETGKHCSDCQCGYRAYPIRALLSLHFFARRYAFETEALAKCIRGGLRLVELPVRVFYPPAGKQRVTHFRPFLDNLRISLMHAHLTLCRLLPWEPPQVTSATATRPPFLRHPILFLKSLLEEHATPGELAASAAVAAILGSLPLIGFQVIAVIYAARALRLNKFLALAIQQLYTPPFAPFIAIELGYFVRHGFWLTSLTLEQVKHDWAWFIGDWAIGGLILGPLTALLFGSLVWLAAARAARNSAAANNLSATRGNRLGIALVRLTLRIFGYRAAYGLIDCVAFCYAAFDREACARIRDYLSMRFPDASDPARLLHTARLFAMQGKMLLLCSTGSVKFDKSRYQAIRDRLNDTSRATVIVISHFSGWQYAIRLLASLDRRIGVLQEPDINLNVSKFMSVGELRADLIPIDTTGFSGGLMICLDLLSNRHLVSVMGDRPGRGATLECTFFGQKIRVTAAPWHLAARCDCEILPAFIHLDPVTRELTFINDTPVRLRAPGEGRVPAALLQEAAQRYVSHLEALARKHPYHFFYFR